MDMKEIQEYLQEKGYTYLIYNKEEAISRVEVDFTPKQLDAWEFLHDDETTEIFYGGNYEID